MEKKRLEYIDMVKGIGILGLVIMHTGRLPEQTASWISSFSTPLFFLVAGMLIGCTGEVERDGKSVLVRKARSLMLPFYSFSLLYILRDLLRVAIGRIDMEEVRMAGISLVTLWGSSVLWFLPALFLSECLFIFLHKKLNTGRTCVAGILLAVASYFLNSVLRTQEAFFLSGKLPYALLCVTRAVLRSIYAVPYLCIGYVLFVTLQDFWKTETTCSLRQLSGGLLLFFSGIPLSVVNGHFNLLALDIGNIPVLAYLSAPLSFTGALLVCKNCRRLKPLVYFGKNSLIVMATHIDFYFMYVAMKLADRVAAWIPGEGRIIFFVNVLGMILILEVICITLINRFFPILAGKRKYFHSPESLI